MRLLEASRLIEAVLVAIGHDNVALFGHINGEPRVFAQMRRMHPGSQLADADISNVFGPIAPGHVQVSIDSVNC